MMPTDLSGMVPAWVGLASCSPSRADDWQAPEGSEQCEEALLVCRDCPVRMPCLVHALHHRECGVWGGMIMSERERLRKAPRRIQHGRGGRMTGSTNLAAAQGTKQL